MFWRDFLCRRTNDLTGLPFLLRCRISLASFNVTPAGATTKSSLFVIAWIQKKTMVDYLQQSHLKYMNDQSCFTLTSSRGLSWSFSDRKSMSLDVTIPTSLLPILPVSVTGIPEKPCRIFASKTSPTVCRGLITTGSVMKPCSNFWWQQTALTETKNIQPVCVCVCVCLKKGHNKSHPEVPTLTLRTSLAWNSAVQLWWIIPIPPINWKENREISETFSKTFESVTWLCGGSSKLNRCYDVCVQSLYSLPWRWPWMTLSLYPWETKWEGSSGLSSSLTQTLDPYILKCVEANKERF